MEEKMEDEIEIEVVLDGAEISGIPAYRKFKDDKLNDIVSVVRNGNTEDYKVVEVLPSFEFDKEYKKRFFSHTCVESVNEPSKKEERMQCLYCDKVFQSHAIRAHVHGCDPSGKMDLSSSVSDASVD